MSNFMRRMREQTNEDGVASRLIQQCSEWSNKYGPMTAKHAYMYMQQQQQKRKLLYAIDTTVLNSMNITAQ